MERKNWTECSRKANCLFFKLGTETNPDKYHYWPVGCTLDISTASHTFYIPYLHPNPLICTLSETAWTILYTLKSHPYSIVYSLSFKSSCTNRINMAESDTLTPTIANSLNKKKLYHFKAGTTPLNQKSTTDQHQVKLIKM